MLSAQDPKDVLLDTAPDPPSLTHLTHPSKSSILIPNRLTRVDSCIQWLDCLLKTGDGVRHLKE